MCLASRELESRHSCIVGTFRVVTWCLGRTVKVHLSVDQIVVGSWSRISTRAESIRYDLIVICMEPVGDEDWTKINVVIRVLWPVDDHWSNRPPDQLLVGFKSCMHLDLPEYCAE